MTKKQPEMPELTPAQLEIMEIIWERGELSASEVRRTLARPGRSRNTVRTLHRADGRERLD